MAKRIKCITIMSIYTEIQTIRFSKQQKQSLAILKSKGVNVNQFIRAAIKEKISREWKSIKVKEEKVYCPF